MSSTSTRITWKQNPRTATPDDDNMRTGTGTYRDKHITVTVERAKTRGVYGIKAYVGRSLVLGTLRRCGCTDATAMGIRAAKSFIDGAAAHPTPAHRPKVLRVQEQHHNVVKLAATIHGCSVAEMTEGIIMDDTDCINALAQARRVQGIDKPQS